MSDIYDQTLNITRFKNKTDPDGELLHMSWSELIRELTNPSRSVSLTRDDYRCLTPSQKADVKDGPGYTAGLFRNNRRAKENMVSRSAITLDIDNSASRELIGELEESLEEHDLSAVMHETASYTEETPRCRVVIPLTRDVTPTEYEFLSRICADELIGIDNFDSTTFQPSRFMYFPLAFARDDSFYSFVSPGSRFFDVDGTLQKYEDWEDKTTWPYSESENRPQSDFVSSREHLPSADRKGLVGAFCACYTPSRAIDTFLADVYERSNTPNRYTYKPGTSPNGLRVYTDSGLVKCEDQSDPANTGKSENAFDLVRIHRFGKFDREYAGRDMGERPSYQRMCDFARSLPEVQAELHERGLENIRKRVQEPFGNDDLSALRLTSGNPGLLTHEHDGIHTSRADWIKNLETYKNSDVTVASVQNLLLIFGNDPKLKDLVGINVFKSGRKQLLKRPPWTHLYDIYGPSWSDLDDKALRNYMNRVYKLTNSSMIDDVLSDVASRTQVHPVKEFIESTQWDGIPRVDSLFIDYLGAEDSSYVREVTRKWFTAAVKRIYEPGCKWDYMPILVGPQGIGKSLLIRKLGKEWTQDTLPDLRQDKASYEALDGYWLVEMGELAGMRKADRDSVKSYITKTSDDFRKAYGHNVETYRRTVVFLGTTNDETFLNDVTGNRRFLPIQCSSERITEHVWDMTDGEVSQVWAEALVIYRHEGKDLMTFSSETNSEAVRQQENVSLPDEWVSVIENWLDEPLSRDFYKKTKDQRRSYFRIGETMAEDGIYRPDPEDAVYRNKVCLIEIWCECFGRDEGSFGRAEQMRLSQAMILVKGWDKAESALRFGPYGTKRSCYVRTRPVEEGQMPESTKK